MLCLQSKGAEWGFGFLWLLRHFAGFESITIWRSGLVNLGGMNYPPPLPAPHSNGPGNVRSCALWATGKAVHTGAWPLCGSLSGRKQMSVCGSQRELGAPSLVFVLDIKPHPVPGKIRIFPLQRAFSIPMWRCEV